MSIQSYNKKSAFSTKKTKFDDVSFDFQSSDVNSSHSGVIEDIEIKESKEAKSEKELTIKNQEAKSQSNNKGVLKKSEHDRWDFVFNHSINNYDDVMAIFTMIENIKSVKEKIEIKKKIKLLVHDEENERKITFTISDDKNKNYLFREC